MKLPLVFLLILCITPLFFGRMRQLPGWLSFQALALAWYGLTDGPQGKAISMHDLLTAAEVVVLRAVLAPWLFSRMLARRNEPDLELMPSNLFTWGIAVSLIALAFEFAQATSSGTDAFVLGVVSTAVVISLLLLSTNATPPAQLAALLYLETALALFETLLPEAWPLPAHLAVSATYVLTVSIGCWLLSHASTASFSMAEKAARDKGLG